MGLTPGRTASFVGSPDKSSISASDAKQDDIVINTDLKSVEVAVTSVDKPLGKALSQPPIKFDPKENTSADGLAEGTTI